MQIVYDIPRPGRKNLALRAASAGIVLLATACGEAGEGNEHELQSAR